MSFTNEEATAIYEMLDRLTTRVQQLELNREFVVLPVMVSERETIRDLVSLASLKFGASQLAIFGKVSEPTVRDARRWVCQQAHQSRGIPLEIIAWVFNRDRSTIHSLIHGKERG